MAVMIIAAFQYAPEWFAQEPSPAVVVEPVVVTEPDPEPVMPPPPVVPPPAPKPKVALPNLDASDRFVVERLAAFDLPALWLDREDLIRRLAVVIDNATRGEYPRRQLGFLAPRGKFQIIERGESAMIMESSGPWIICRSCGS